MGNIMQIVRKEQYPCNRCQFTDQLVSSFQSTINRRTDQTVGLASEIDGTVTRELENCFEQC